MSDQPCEDCVFVPTPDGKCICRETPTNETDFLGDPRVQPDSYVIYPSCYDQMGNSDRDMFCLSVTNGHAWGWKVHRFGFTGREAMNRKGEWIYESRGSGNNKPRRWTLDEALSIALRHVDTHRINGRTAADCAAAWPRDEESP